MSTNNERILTLEREMTVVKTQLRLLWVISLASAAALGLEWTV